MSSGLWCADFVNGALAKAGGKGTGSSLARSFFRWGQHVGNDNIQKGDVLVSGGHVGFARGPAQMHNGRPMVPMISGNHGHRVGESWEPLGKYEARRATGLNAPPSTAGGAAPPVHGKVEAHVHVHGDTHKTTVTSTGMVEARLTRWPTMTQPSREA